MPLKRAIALIFLSTAMISGSFAAGLFFWKKSRSQQFEDPHYQIIAIVQTCRGKEPLQTNFLAELLELSIDQPTNLHAFNVKRAEKLLLKCPLIKKARVKKISPGTLQIDYVMRKPIAYLPELTNTALSADHVLIPIHPFYTPKNIPGYIMGFIQPPRWGDRIAGKKVILAQELHKVLAKGCEPNQQQLKFVDVARAFNKRWGHREIVVGIGVQKRGQKETIFHLRLASKNWQQQLEDFYACGECLAAAKERVSVVDLRIPRLAFLLSVNH